MYDTISYVHYIKLLFDHETKQTWKNDWNVNIWDIKFYQNSDCTNQLYKDFVTN